MGYRIDFTPGKGTLFAVVRGKSSLAYSACISHEIAEQASAQEARRVLIDLRGLADCAGTIGSLLPVRGTKGVPPKCRVAVLDSQDNDRYHAWHALPCFSRPIEALRWLGAAD